MKAIGALIAFSIAVLPVTASATFISSGVDNQNQGFNNVIWGGNTNYNFSQNRNGLAKKNLFPATNNNRFSTTLYNFNGSSPAYVGPIGGFKPGGPGIGGSFNPPAFGRNPTSVPAPSMLLLLGLGLGVIGLRRRKLTTA